MQENSSGFRFEGFPVFWNLVYINKEGPETGPTISSDLKGFPIFRGSGLEGFHCTVKGIKLREFQNSVCL